MLDRLVARIGAGRPFAFSRWGDGEWSCILGHGGSNCDGHPYSKLLRLDLTAVLLARPTYHLGMQAFALRRFGPAIEAWLARRGLGPTWVDADLFAMASWHDELTPLTDALACRAVILAGPDYLSALSLFKIARHIVIPERNCYVATAATLAATDRALRHLPRAVVVISAGMSANILVHRLHAAHPRATLIDVGSLWEPYVGRATRRYHRAVLARLRGAA